MNGILTVVAVSLAVVAMSTHGGAQTQCNRIKHGGFLRQSMRIDAYNSPCVISNDLIIGATATLTVDPGVTLQFSPGVMLAVNGTLIARVSVNHSLSTHNSDGRFGKKENDSIRFSATTESIRFNSIRFTALSEPPSTVHTRGSGLWS